ncbi:MAG: dephospho-CoA kinase [bacterium]
MIKIGITGSIGSGKSTVSRMFQEAGAKVIDADKVAKKAMAPFKPAWWAVYEYFGSSVVCPENSQINRVRLGELVFGDPFFLRKLNCLVHPLIIEEMKAELQQLQNRGVKLAVLDVPLLIEAGLRRLVDFVVVVCVEQDVQIARLQKRHPGLTVSEIMQRIHSQMSLAAKKKYADFIIHNNGRLEETRNQVGEVLQEVMKRKDYRESG